MGRGVIAMQPHPQRPGGRPVRTLGLAIIATAAPLLLAACGPDVPNATPTASSSPRSTTRVQPSATASPSTVPFLVRRKRVKFGPEPSYATAGFSEPTRIDNRWFPLRPGTRFVYEGKSEDDGTLYPHRFVMTVTDLVKVIGGIPNVVVWDEDYISGKLRETELSFYAQSDSGDVWHFGEHPEEYDEHGALEDAPTWMHGYQGASAGIIVQADPSPGTPSYAQGWAPAVDWTDRAEVHSTLDSYCVVRATCYRNVLVVAEFSQDERYASQYKYYAAGVGNIHVGFGGDDPTHEKLDLVRVERLGAPALEAVRTKARKLERHAYQVSQEAYGKTAPMTVATR